MFFSSKSYGAQTVNLISSCKIRKKREDKSSCVQSDRRNHSERKRKLERITTSSETPFISLFQLMEEFWHQPERKRFCQRILSTEVWGLETSAELLQALWVESVQTLSSSSYTIVGFTEFLMVRRVIFILSTWRGAKFATPKYVSGERIIFSWLFLRNNKHKKNSKKVV